ncbi:MAG TPA: hypothetical protein VNL77_11755 [Roseiflexaceae bacterium]|nr:hypothetical protein [Roseiflexaceae bacterium]
MAFVHSHHAQEEIALCGIPQDLVDSVLNSPQQIVPEHGGRVTYQSQLDFGEGRIFLLCAIVVDTIEPTGAPHRLWGIIRIRGFRRVCCQ